MLKGNRAMNVDAAPRHAWDNEDWDRIATELQRLHTDWRNHQFTMDEFEDAMETVIAQEHHRAFPSMDDVMPNLYMAFARRSPDSGKPSAIKKPVALVNSVGAIRWTPDEWEQVVLEIHRLAPMMFEDRCAKLTFKELRAAQSILPLSRRREPNQIEIYRKQILKTWDSLPDDVRDPRLQDRKIVDFPSGPVMEPPKQRSDDSSAIAIAMHKGFQAPEKPAKPEAKPITLGKVKHKRHSYDATDWLNIAREMYRQNPHAPYFTSAFQTVDLPALRAAQREIIPLERRRSIYGNHGLAAPLVAAFKALKEELEAKKEEADIVPNSAIEQTESVTSEWREQLYPGDPNPKPLFRPAMPVIDGPFVPKKVSTPVHPVSSANEPSDFLSRIVAASKPLIGVIVAEFRQGIAEEVAKILLPQITGALTPMLESSLQGVKDAIAAQFNPWSTGGLAQSALPIHTPDYAPAAQAASVPNNPPSSQNMGILQAAAQTLIAKTVEKPKKLKIAIIGPRGGQEEQVRRAFPEFDFTFIENGHGIKESGAHCALFIASNAYLNRANRDSLKAHVSPEKVRYIDGGMSTIKRTINVWVATQNNKSPTL